MRITKPYPEVEVRFDEDTHRFFIRDGKKEFKVCGVTSITGIIDKSNILIAWAVRTMKEYLINNWNGEKCKNETEVMELIERASQEHKIKRDVAGTIGKMTHDWAEQFTSGKNPKMPTNEQVKNGVVAFLQWVETKKIKFLEAERIIYSKKHKYAGITDCIARIGKELVLIDYKTGNSVYPEHRIQVCGYIIAYEEETDKEIKSGIIIKFDKDNGEFQEIELSEKDIKDGKKAFLNCLEIKKYLSIK